MEVLYADSAVWSLLLSSRFTDKRRLFFVNHSKCKGMGDFYGKLINRHSQAFGMNRHSQAFGKECIIRG